MSPSCTATIRRSTTDLSPEHCSFQLYLSLHGRFDYLFLLRTAANCQSKVGGIGRGGVGGGAAGRARAGEGRRGEGTGCWELCESFNARRRRTPALVDIWRASERPLGCDSVTQPYLTRCTRREPARDLALFFSSLRPLFPPTALPPAPPAAAPTPPRARDADLLPRLPRFPPLVWRALSEDISRCRSRTSCAAAATAARGLTILVSLWLNFTPFPTAASHAEPTNPPPPPPPPRGPARGRIIPPPLPGPSFSYYLDYRSSSLSRERSSSDRSDTNVFSRLARNYLVSR